MLSSFITSASMSGDDWFLSGGAESPIDLSESVELPGVSLSRDPPHSTLTSGISVPRLQVGVAPAGGTMQQALSQYPNVRTGIVQTG